MPGGYTGSILWDNQSVETFTIPYGGAFSMAFQIPINTTVDEHTITVCRGVPCYTDDLMQGQTVTFGVTDLLPVELVAFDAVADGEAITLSWETASETNNAGFEVEQLEAAAAWTAVAFVEGQGTTEAATAYTHRLDGLAPGAYTFRLKQIDFDGAFTYGPEVQAVIEVGGVYRLSAAYPNPFNPQTQFTLSVARTQHVTVAAFDLLGRRVAMLHAGELQAGTAHPFRFEAGGLAGGLYLIRVEGETFATSQTVTVLK
jgi:hypothetical protein